MRNDRLPFKEAGVPELEEINKRDILTKEELCVYLSVPSPTIRALLTDKNFPRCRIGRYVQFSKKAVESWVLNGGSTDNGD